MLEIPECSPVDNLHKTTLTQSDVLCGAAMNANQTFTVKSVNDSINFWDENLNLMSNEDSGSQKYLTFCNYSDSESFDGDESIFFSKMESQTSSLDMLRRASPENNCCSLSSGETIMRSNSFCLDNQAPVVVSSLDESLSANDIGALPTESNMLSDTLPDNSEYSSEQMVKDKANPCLNMTFTPAVNWDCPTEENDVALSNFIVALPTESEGGLLMTFVCETPADCRQEEKLPETEPLPLTLGAVAQDQKSPLCESDGITRVQIRKKQIPVTPQQHAVAGQTANKAKTLEIKKFPKSDYSKIKSKIVTRAMHQVTAPGPTLQRKASRAEMNSKHIETQSRAKSEMTPAKVRKSVRVASIKTQSVDFGINTAAASVGETLKGPNAVNQQDESKVKPSDYQPAADEHATADQCSDAACEYDQTASHEAGSDPACLSILEKSPNNQIGLQPTPKKVLSNKNEVRSGSALGQNKPSVVTTRPRCSSESSSASQPPIDKKRTLRFSSSFTFSRGKTHQNRTKADILKCSSQREQAIPAKRADPPVENSPKEVDGISLVEQDGKSASGPSRDFFKSTFRRKTPSQSTRGALPSQVPVANPKLIPFCLRVKTPGKIGCQTPKAGATLPLKPKRSTAGTPKVQSSLGSRSSVSSRPQLSGSQRHQTPIHPSLISAPPTPSWRLPCKTGPSVGPIEAGEHGNGSITQVSHGAGPKPNPLKSISLKTKLSSTPAKNTKPTLTSTCTSAASTRKTPSASTPGLLKHSASARLVRPTLSALVDKNKSRSSFRQQTPQPSASKPSQGTKPPDLVPSSSVGENERKEHVIQQLTRLLAASNCRFEALAIVLQQSLAERDEATKQCRELSQELVNLQGELVCSINSSERLEKEKDELRVTLEDALHRVQEEHQRDLAELEERLQAFYQAEWNKMHLAYQEEADKCNTVMKQQMGELEAKHEAMKQQIENSHVEQLQSVKQQYEISLDELKQVHHQELQSLDKNLKEAESSLTVRIQQLTEENDALLEKLTAEENRRKEWAQRSQKDSHTLYLEQELESLKVVLDMKTTQLHQQEKKLMEIDKLTEKNLKLDEILKKVQQENEDLKARMERQAALSRQLSTEQAVLQESLQKESKVNKRLSMENEELLWKLNNDLSGSRKASPTSSSSPSHSFSLQSPRSSGLLSSPPVSPR